MAITGYHHLTYEDRCQIYALKKVNTSNSAIARQLGVDPSTVGRELDRNKGKRGYRYVQAQNFAANRKKKASQKPRKMTATIISIIEKKLCDFQWSPEQISGWLRLNAKFNISHERIYQHIWINKRNGGCLYKNLRHHGKKYNKRNGKSSGRGLIPNRIDIEERPKIVDEKLRVGDWEIDTIIGKNHIGALVSMVDRASKYTKLALVESKKSCIVAKAIECSLLPIHSVVHTLTADNGKEFAMHEKISESLQAKIYFAKPYRSWERGLNEHTNGLIRQYFPKKTCFDKLLPSDVQKVENLLNMRPRKILNFRTPLEIFEKAKLNPSKIALQS